MSQHTAEHDLVERLLDTLPVTDRVFHDLKHTQPLVEALVGRVKALMGEGRILIVASNALLPVVLDEAGYDVELWRVPESSHLEQFDERTVRTGPIQQLLTDVPAEPRYDLIILPFVLEAVSDHPVSVLRRMLPLLRPGGRLVIAYRPAGSLENRLTGLAGRAPLADPGVGTPAISYSWPLTSPVRLFGRSEFDTWCSRVGLRIVEQDYVMDAHATVAINAMSLTAWLGAKLRHAVKRALPAVRSAAVAVVAPHPIDRKQPFEDAEEHLARVTAVVRGQDPQRIARVLSQLADQTYPQNRLDVIVLQPGTPKAGDHYESSSPLRVIATDNPSGATAADLAAQAATGDILAFTDEYCEVARNWIEAGATGLDGWTVALAGAVREKTESAKPFLVLPGSRHLESDEGWFSTFNVFFRRDALLEAGGFSGDGPDRGTGEAWANYLAYRLIDLGYVARFDPAVEVVRLFPFVHPQAPRRQWMVDEFRRANDLPLLVRRSRGMRQKLLKSGLFASWRTMSFDLLLAGLAAAALRRRPAFALFAIPFMIGNRRYLPFWPPRLLKPAARNFRGIVFRHGIWLAGMALGSIRARRIVL